MGSYLSSPITDKISSDESNDKLLCGASSMQGWRDNQEDSHNCILDYDTNTAFFAVYDGHGGHEVAKYCSDKLPDYIKETEAYKKNNIENALIDGFLGFDATIATPEVVTILSEIASEREAKVDSDEEENVDNLYEEAAMPIEQVIEKYTSNIVNSTLRTLKKESEKLSKSPCLRAKRDDDNGVDSSGCSSETNQGASSSSAEPCNDGVSSSSGEESEARCAEKDSKPKDTDSTTEKNGTSTTEVKVTESIPDSSDSKVSSEADVKKKQIPIQNGEAATPEDVTSSSPSQENGDISKKGKGKSPAKGKGSPAKPTRERPKRNATQLYKQILSFKDDEEESDDSEDEEDKTFNVSNDASSDEEGEALNSTVEGENSDATSDEEEGDEEEDEEEDEDEDEELDDDEDDIEFTGSLKEKAGSDSGCTAVVALLKGKELYVANAGDSRCVVCRAGKAVEMSFDHKPEDELENQRIEKAGGYVCSGRVNGGLNLSRAIGDHAYKRNTELSDKEQMITALPDIKTLTINPKEDEFMVLACDGIWNFMSSQQVVDFVRSRILEGREKLSQICEEMFDHCLAPHTRGDGTGCDNMTAIIVQFKKSILKRGMSPEPEDTSNSKKAKTDENESQIDTTA